MEHSKIYTKKGDAGETGIIGGKRVPKISLTIEAVGMCDELNSALGLVISNLPKEAERTTGRLQTIQRQIFAIGATIAGNASWPTSGKHVEQLEQWIDEIDAQLSPLGGFILPGGSVAGASGHLARAVCRRCERQFVRFTQEHPIDPVILQYFNRLGDFLFVLARWINKNMNEPEQPWHP